MAGNLNNMNAYGFMDDSSSVIPPSLAVSSSSGVQGDGTVSNPVRLNADTLSSGTVAGTDNFVTSSSGNLDGQLTPVNTVPSFVLRGDTGSDTVNLTENVNILGDTNTKIKTEITGANELTISLDTTGATLGQIPAVNVSGGISFVTPSSGITNLSTGNITTTTLDIVSDTGADATLPSATVTTAGLMSAQDKVDMASLLSNQHIPATVTDGQSIDLTITGQDITAELVGLASASLGQVPTKNGTGGISWVTPIVTDDAIEVNYDNTTSGLTATDIQSAIDEVEGRVDTLETGLAANTAVDVVQAAQIAALQTSTHAAATVNATSNPALTIAGQDLKLDLDVAGSYNNTTSGLASTSVQDAIDELASQTTSGANNGLSVSADKTVLGQDVGQAGNPAQLTSDREIPTNNFNFTIGTGSTTTGSRSFNIGRNQSLSGVDSYIIGNSNTGNASDNIYAFGELNNVSAAAAVAVGISNQVSAGGSLAFGRDLNNSVPTTLDLGMSASSYLKMSSTDIKLINITPTSTSTTLENLAIDTSNGQVVRDLSVANNFGGNVNSYTFNFPATPSFSLGVYDYYEFYYPTVSISKTADLNSVHNSYLVNYVTESIYSTQAGVPFCNDDWYISEYPIIDGVIHYGNSIKGSTTISMFSQVNNSFSMQTVGASFTLGLRIVIAVKAGSTINSSNLIHNLQRYNYSLTSK